MEKDEEKTPVEMSYSANTSLINADNEENCDISKVGVADEKNNISEMSIPRFPASNTALLMKYTSLVILTLQNTALVLVMRYARTRQGTMFLASVGVIMGEWIKLAVCLIFLTYEHGWDPIMAWIHLRDKVIRQPFDTMKVAVPSLIYTIQNNLLYVAVSNLDAATFQVSYQLKIFTTAVFSVVMLSKKLSRTQWFSLGLLFLGVSIVQISNMSPSSSPSASNQTSAEAAQHLKSGEPEQSYSLGISAVLIACLLSGFAGVYFEKILKGSDLSLWLRNIQLAALSLPLAFMTAFISDGNKIMSEGFFVGFDWLVWVVILLQSLGGLVVAVVVKYADNILKGFATSAAIVLSCLLTWMLFSTYLTALFNIGATCVVAAVFFYSAYPPAPVRPQPSSYDGKQEAILQMTDCQDWGFQEEYDATASNSNVSSNENIEFIEGKAAGGDLESFFINKDGFTFVVSSDLGGNVWQGFVGVYDSWSVAEKCLETPVAYYADSSTTYSCGVGLNECSVCVGADKGTVEFLRYTVLENCPDVRIYQSLMGHDDCITSISLFPDSQYLVSGSFDCTSKFWDLENGTCVSTSEAASGSTLGVAASPVDMNLYCSASRDGNLYLIDNRICSGVPPSVLKNPSTLSAGAYPTSIVWPKSAKDIIYAGFSDGSLVCFDLKEPSLSNGEQNEDLFVSCRLHNAAITTIDIHSENPSMIVCGSEDGAVSVYHKSEKRHSVVGRHNGFVRCVKWRMKDSESSICSAGWDGKLRSFDLPGSFHCS